MCKFGQLHDLLYIAGLVAQAICMHVSVNMSTVDVESIMVMDGSYC